MNTATRIDLTEGPILKTQNTAGYLHTGNCSGIGHGAVIGQNFGARRYHRITGSFWTAWSISMLFMLGCTGGNAAIIEFQF